MDSLNIDDINSNAANGRQMRLERIGIILELYRSVGVRNTYLFRWLMKMYENLTLSCADASYHGILAMDKTKLAIIDVLIDDVADNANIRDKRFLDEICKVPFEYHNIEHMVLTEKQRKYLEVTKIVWDNVFSSITKYPRYHEFKEIFEFDMFQVINSIKHGYLINTVHHVANSLENKIYGHHAMLVIVAGMMDIMCSPGFDMGELRTMRKILYNAQMIARIGNMVSTYHREIIEKDITSEIITIALEEGVISPNELDAAESMEEKVRPLMERFRNDWDSGFNEIKKLLDGVKSIDADRFMRERVFIKDSYDKRVQYWLDKYADRSPETSA